jgi:hypothetical protein
MIESGKCLELINEKIAILSNEIGRSGKLTFLNIHKQCENLIKRILNTAFDYQLEDLNDGKNNFFGLDIGDKTNSLAFQISSDKSSSKVNDALEKVIKHEHYKSFRNIRMFVLGYKQESYAINVTTEPHFVFNWKTDIWDFDTLMLKLRPLEVDKLKATYDLLSKELPYTIEALKGEDTGNVEKMKSIENKSVTLLDINSSLKQTGFKFFEHWVCNIKVEGASIPAAKLNSCLEVSIRFGASLTGV